jgi:hypothetical protein
LVNFIYQHIYNNSSRYKLYLVTNLWYDRRCLTYTNGLSGIYHNLHINGDQYKRMHRKRRGNCYSCQPDCHCNANRYYLSFIIYNLDCFRRNYLFMGSRNRIKRNYRSKRYSQPDSDHNLHSNRNHRFMYFDRDFDCYCKPGSNSHCQQSFNLCERVNNINSDWSNNLHLESDYRIKCKYWRKRHS